MSHNPSTHPSPRDRPERLKPPLPKFRTPHSEFRTQRAWIRLDSPGFRSADVPGRSHPNQPTVQGPPARSWTPLPKFRTPNSALREVGLTWIYLDLLGIT